MAVNVHFNREFSRLRFTDLPTVFLKYTESDPRDERSFVQLRVTDAQTLAEQSVFFRIDDLRKKGISFQVWSAVAAIGDPKSFSEFLQIVNTIRNLLKEALPIVSQHTQSLAFFQDIYFATRVISAFTFSKKDRNAEQPGVRPGIYLHKVEDGGHIFINLPCQNLGEGTYATISKVLWLNAAAVSDKIVAKKVLKQNMLDNCHLKVEIAALALFKQKRGIMPVICGGVYDGEAAIFMPCYNYSLLQYVERRGLPYSVDEALRVTSQWLEGLATIHKLGIHGDLSLRNLLLRGRDSAIEGVIADFGAYRSYGDEIYGVTTIVVAPPEYYKEIYFMTAKHDIWAMGLCCYALFSKKLLPFMKYKEKDLIDYILPLKPGWICTWRSTMNRDTPDFILDILDSMLDPRQSFRWSADEALTRFTEGYTQYQKAILE